MRYIEQQSARSIGHVRGAFTGEAKAHIVLGKQKVPHALPVLRFVFADPKNFREREVGERGVAGELNQTLQAKSLGKVVALLFGAHVAPDQRGTNDVSLLIEKDGAMHLAGETQARNVFPREFRVP